jgi:E3 Ubiquitin ligase
MEYLGPIIAVGVILLIGGAITAFLVYLTIKFRNRLKLIEAAPLCTADQLRTGLAKMRGKIVSLVDEDDMLISPLTKTLCVYYKFVVEEQRTRTVSTGRGMRTETYWHPVITDIQAVHSAVKDKTGEAVVDLKMAEITLTQSCQAKTGLFSSAPKGLERRLQQLYGFSTKGFIFSKSLRYSEMVIEEGVKVFVVGDVKARKDGSSSFRKGENPLLVTDKNEQELVSHFKWRFTAALIGAIVVPLLFLTCAGFVGVVVGGGMIGAHAVDKQIQDNQQAVQKAQEDMKKQGQKPGPQKDEITKLLDEIKNAPPAADKFVPVRAIDQLNNRAVDPARKEEVAQVLNAPLLSPDTFQRDAALRAMPKWGTTKANLATLQRLQQTGDANTKNEAKKAIDAINRGG